MTITDSSDRSATMGATHWPEPRPAWKDAAIVFLVALACYFPYPLDTPLAATEGHRAVTAHQMVESGQWLIPKLFGRVYLAKPPLHYWILAASETLFGTTRPWVWRLPGAVEGASLAAILCVFANRWFGGRAGLVSGFAYVALFTLWGENRGADIDVTNTLTTTLACLWIIDMHAGSRALLRPTPGKVLAAGLAVGLSLMVKGPASLTIILGTYLALLRVLWPDTGWRWVVRPTTWLPLLIGVAVFASYALAAWLYIRSHHLVADLSGVKEGAKDLRPRDVTAKGLFEWVALPATMFAYSMPVSLALLFGFNREVRGTEPVRARLMRVLAWSVVLAWGVCFVSGMHLPRYAFVTLAVLCPLAGAVAARLPALRVEADRWVRLIVGVSLVIFCGAAVVLAGMSWKTSGTGMRAVLAIVAAATVCLTLVTLRGIVRPGGWRALWGMPLTLMLVSSTFAIRQHFDRVRRSTIPQAQLIRSVTGPDARLVTCRLVLDQPDLFYYTGLPTVALEGKAPDSDKVPLNTWVVLEPPELESWQKKVSTRLWNQTAFVANRNAGILFWYGEAPPPGRQR